MAGSTVGLATLHNEDQVRLKDVRPGDTVTYTLVVTGKRPSNSIPGWGLLFNQLEAVNQRNELVYHAELVGFSKLRDYRLPLRLQLLQALTRLPLLGKLVQPSR